MIVALNFSKNELIHVCFTAELKNFVVYCVFLAKFLVLHDFNLTYYSNVILDSFSILLFPKLCWHIGLTPICIDWSIMVNLWMCSNRAFSIIFLNREQCNNFLWTSTYHKHGTVLNFSHAKSVTPVYTVSSYHLLSEHELQMCILIISSGSLHVWQCQLMSFHSKLRHVGELSDTCTAFTVLLSGRILI